METGDDVLSPETGESNDGYVSRGGDVFLWVEKKRYVRKGKDRDLWEEEHDERNKKKIIKIIIICLIVSTGWV